MAYPGTINIHNDLSLAHAQMSHLMFLPPAYGPEGPRTYDGTLGQGDEAGSRSQQGGLSFLGRMLRQSRSSGNEEYEGDWTFSSDEDEPRVAVAGHTTAQLLSRPEPRLRRIASTRISRPGEPPQDDSEFDEGDAGKEPFP